jgi:nitroreductase
MISTSERVIDERAQAVLEVMRTRRVVRSFTDEPVSESELRMILESGRWALSAGNRYISKFLVVQDPSRIRLVRTVSPGMLAKPTALIVILTDLDKAAEQQVQIDRDTATAVDVGTAAQNMSVMALALGLGSCPATSFSRSGVSATLDVPPRFVPEFILQVGHPAPEPRVMRPGAVKKLSVESLTYWEQVGRPMPRRTNE